jgi:hypothetical protein
MDPRSLVISASFLGWMEGGHCHLHYPPTTPTSHTHINPLLTPPHDKKHIPNETITHTHTHTHDVQVPTPYGDVAIEEFDLGRARELDVIFLAVGGDFSKDYAHKLAEGVRMYAFAFLSLSRLFYFLVGVFFSLFLFVCLLNRGWGDVCVFFRLVFVFLVFGC